MNRSAAAIVSLIALGLSSVACGSIPKKTIEFEAISVDTEQPLPAMVVVNGEWASASENKQFLNVKGSGSLRLTIAFPSPQVMVTVAPLQTDLDTGEVIGIPQRIEDAKGHMTESRELRFTDPAYQLFILEPR